MTSDLTELHARLREDANQLDLEMPESRWQSFAEPDIVKALVSIVEDVPVASAREGLLRNWRSAVLAVARRPLDAEVEAATDQPIEMIARLYRSLGPRFQDRHLLLSRLGRMATPASLRALVTLLVGDPPAGAEAASAALIPLFSLRAAEPLETLFPGLLACLANPDLAAGILDLANFHARAGRLSPHPAHQRAHELQRLTEAVVAHLSSAQEQAADTLASRQAAQAVVAQSVPLGVSLADALGLIGDPRAIPTLERLGELRHRRLRVEAAAALCRLGEETAADLLVALAAEPVVRLRVLAYAEELDLLDRVDEEYSSPLAIAEAQLYAFLAQPTQMGVPPQRCELVDQRTLSWPGYEEPRDCYLFRYEYALVDQDGTPRILSNLAISGPLVHAFYADMAELPVEDVYAAFAGWQAEHEEIRTHAWPPRELDAETSALLQKGQEEFTTFEPLARGDFFGDRLLIAQARRDDLAGTAIVDAMRVDWYPSTGRRRPIGPAEAFCIYKGRRLLASFNSEWSR